MEPRNPVSKTLRALSWLIESSSPQVGVRELAAAMNIAPSSAHRILVALSQAGFVRRDVSSQRYTLTAEFFRLSQRAAAMSPLRQAGLAALRRLVDACGESALLGVYDDARQEMIFAAAVDAPHATRQSVRLDEWLPVRTGASGLAILAFLDEAERHSVIAHSARCAPAARTTVATDGLDRDLAHVRAQGYAFTRCQWITGAVGLAAPIFDRRGKVMGDVCVTIPEHRCQDGGHERLIAAMRRCVDDVTARMRGGEAAVAG
jgi:DNA-binding IclR family transcriptional regulator